MTCIGQGHRQGLLVVSETFTNQFPHSKLTLVVPVSLDIPVSVSVSGVVLVGASNFDLLKTPLRQVGVASAKVATKDRVLKTESRSQGSDSAAVARGRVTDNFNLPVIFIITNSQIAVGGNLTVALGNRCSNLVGVKVASGLGVDETDNGTISNVADIGGVDIVVSLGAVGVEEPVIVRILVVVASNLLLLRTFGISLDVRVQETATITHVLDGSARSNGNFKRAVLSDLCSLEVGLE